MEPAPYSGFPWWLRWQHFFNLFFMMFIIRAGVQILADHPRLYWNRHSTPGTEWFRFQKPVPTDRVWTAKEDSVRLPGWMGIPGIRHSIGLARWWHFGFDTLWIVNGVIFYILLFSTSQWQRIVPTSWDVIPNAVSTAIQYLSLDFPANEGWIAYNGLQLLAYFFTVFIAAPLALITGLMQSPAINNRFKFAGRILNRQAARSIHYFVLIWILSFILIHTTMIYITRFLGNLNHITTGQNSTSWLGFIIYAVWMAVIIVAWLVASPVTLRYPRVVQRVGRVLIGPLKGALEHLDPRPGEYTEKDISPHLWPNGKMPDSKEFAALEAGDFRDYRLRIDGLVANPVELSLADLRAMPFQEQITQHFCIQGWSGVAKWGGVPMRAILDLVGPLPEAQYVAFYALSSGGPDRGTYYDVHSMEGMRHELTLLAYEMNGETLSVLHGAPLRLRNEVEVGFKMVKWIGAMEFITDFKDLGNGQGGYNEDHEFFGYRDSI
ncbi:molybdopterin-dependent oxidoreductase [Homoserinimonas sp. OAct 916]|uniref:molybdopterin-dependent oxidoreductase n=1 Tax=Homoserinimonas sp. OAct 916 TaxID=2211450 RepID=UPI000DBEA093|nr:molybdopterin-dependent oxidoreductase [Homoserinimonas sp. OAct 916]